MVEITMNIDKIKRGPGFWELNNSLLDDNNYKSNVDILIEETWEETKDITDTRIRFNFLKYKIMTRTIEHSILVAKTNREKEFKVIEILQNIDKIIIKLYCK